jgi:site-specific DNA-methyltransferase (cytosine-N4-specific)
MPVRSLYIERLLLALVDEAKFFFADRHIWRNPACAPTSPFVTIQKVRAGQDWESVLWLGKTGSPKADATRVMEPAKASTIATYLAKARRGQAVKTCESGHKNIFEEQVARAVAGEPVMVLPRSVQTFANSDPMRTWKAQLAAAGLPAHPARMPIGLARWWISFLTDVGDLVHDPFGGSGTVPLAAEQLGRRWTSSDRSLTYALGAALRFEAARFDPDAVGAVA